MSHEGTTCDVREVGRVVASVLLAAGDASASAVAQADAGLARLGRPPLDPERDFVVSTPEELAPLVPFEHRAPLAELLLELGGPEPLARRVASAYVGLWKLPPPRAPLSDRRPERVCQVRPANRRGGLGG